MQMRAPHWFAIGLAAGLFFLWCLVSAIEGGVHAGWIWGFFVSGIIGIVGFAMAAIRFWGEGQRFGEDRLLSGSRAAFGPRGASDRLRGAGDVPRSAGDVPRPASGRPLI